MQRGELGGCGERGRANGRRDLNLFPSGPIVAGKTSIVKVYFKGNDLQEIEVTEGTSLVIDDLDVKQVVVKVTGKSKVVMNGRATSLNVTLDFSANFISENLITENATLVLDNESTAAVNVSKALYAKMKRRASVTCIGRPELVPGSDSVQFKERPK